MCVCMGEREGVGESQVRAEWGRLAAGGASKPWTGGFVMLAGLPPCSPQ